MKKLLEIIDIFHIKISAIALFVLAALFGYIKPLLLYFLIAFIHELCHLIACIVFKIKPNAFIILPFGATLEVSNINNIKSIRQIIIYLAGPFSFFINLIWINMLFKISIINNVNYEFLLNANLIMCLLNLLPIFPLDGFIVIKAILQLLIPYKNVLKVSTIISLISFIGFCIYNIFDFQPMVLFFLLFEQIKYILSYKNNYKNFLIYKTLFKKERSFKIINDYNMYKDSNNYKFETKKILNDKEIASIELKNYIN